MRNNIQKFALAVLVTSGAITLSAQVDENGRKRSESPFFEIIGKRTEGATETLPLLSTSAEVNIAGVIADVKVTQVYVNRGSKPIEASYIFPASTRAAVYAMQFTLGKRVVKAEIHEKQKAQQTYQKAKDQGKTAALLQQHRPNVFQMNLANIMPGDTINVEMLYTENVLSENGVYEFSYPTVVGPRYSGDAITQSRAKENWLSTKYHAEKHPPTYLFDIKTKINAGVPLDNVTCSSHQVNVVYNDPTIARVDLVKEDSLSGNRDFILKYRLTGTKISNGMLVYEGENENYFMLMMQPPKVVSKKARPAREYIFIMDVSGSQSGFPLEVSKELMRNLLKNLEPQDKFNVLVFEGHSGFWSPKSLSANAKNISEAVSFIDQQTAGGGTELLSALKKAMTFPHSKNYSRSFVIATDGYVSIEKDAFDYIKSNLGDANFFAFGIGTGVNRFLVEGIAHAGMGEPFIVANEQEAKVCAEKFKNYISNPVLTNIQVNYEGFEVYDLVTKKVPDVFSLRPIVLFGKYKGTAAGKIHISGTNGLGKYDASVDVSAAKASTENKALKYLWARNKIREYDLAGKIGKEVKSYITKLGLKYGLLTDYTSFVAVDNEIRNTSTRPDSIPTILPLPLGVSNAAVCNTICNGTTVSFCTSGGTSGYSYAWNFGGAATVTGTSSSTYTVSVTDGNGCTTFGNVQDPKNLGWYSMSGKNDYKQVSVDTVAYFSSVRSIDAEIERLEGEQTVKIELKDLEKAKSEPSNSESPEDKKLSEQVIGIKEDEVNTLSDVLPQFPGGENEFQKFIQKNLKYPAYARLNGIQGTVFLRVVIDEKGKLKSVKVIRGVTKTLNEEALRIARLVPNWSVQQTKTKGAETEFTLPVKFTL
jgi:Ca-activated chloride channel homolog